MSDNHRENKSHELQELRESGYRPDSVTRTAFYFGTQDRPLIGWLHTSPEIEQQERVVVVCPPLAVEYMSTYRALRYVCDYFALAGIPAVHFDYAGTGDSSGLNEDADQVQGWLWSIEQAIETAMLQTGCTKVGLFGLRFGGTLAGVISEKCPLDFMVLWAPLVSGKRYMREMRALQITDTTQAESSGPEYFNAGGSVIWSQTAEEISRLNLLDVTPKARRILIVPRDDFKSDDKLQTVWREKGLDVVEEELPGYQRMLELAYYSIVPHKSIQHIVQWVCSVKDGIKVNRKGPMSTSLPLSSEILQYNSCNDESSSVAEKVRERIVRFGAENDRFGIVTEPLNGGNKDLPVILIVNSGANHRVGPSRLYVLLARELARRGFYSLRYDIPGLGDSIMKNPEFENEEYIENSSDEVNLAIQCFEDLYHKAKYISIGLCSGAYFSFHAALDLRDRELVEGIIINPLTFYWVKGMEFDETPAKQFSYWNWYKQAMRDPKSWMKLLRGRINFSALFNTIKNRIKIVFASKLKVISGVKPATQAEKQQSRVQNLGKDLDMIAEQGRKVTMVLSKNDPGYDILMTSAGPVAKKLIKDQVMKIYIIENADHTFSRYKPRCNALKTMINHIVESYSGQVE